MGLLVMRSYPQSRSVLVWMFLSNSITDGTNCLLADTSTIQNMKLPLTFFPALCLTKQLINFFHSLLIILGVSLVFPPESLFSMLFVVPAIGLLCIFLFFVMLLLGMLSARFRDIQPLVMSVMPMLFFLSPVLFRIQQAENISWLIWLNPFTYFVVIIREPLQGSSPSIFVVSVAVTMTIVCYLVASAVFRTKSKQVVYWL